MVKEIPECTKRETTDGWRTLQDEQLHNLYKSPNNIRTEKKYGGREKGKQLLRNRK
jgi:hypothetical protein